MSFNQTFRNLKRTREIIQVLVKFGFEDLVAQSTLRKFVPEKNRLKIRKGTTPKKVYNRYAAIRMVCEELGPTFIKLAQILSTRPDMIPEGLLLELEKLQDRVPPFPFEEVKNIIQTESGKLLNDLFDDFQEEPIAAASIGQVHLAKLKTGEKVVVKIQRPKIQDIIDTDLSIIAEGAKRAEQYLKKQGVLNPDEVVKSFERTIRKELDYRNEARNMDRFRRLYKEYTNFYIPKPYKNLTTEKFMTIEYVEGTKIDNVPQLRKWGLDPKKIAENGMGIYLTQIFEYGVFHADPHPGNVLVRKDGTICLLDFGMTGNLLPKDKQNFANIFISMSNGDARQMAINLRKLATSHEIQDMRALEYDLNNLIEDNIYLDVDEASIADVNIQLQKIMYQYSIAVPGSIFLIFRAFAILEGIGKKIHPDFNTYEFIKPYGAKILKDQFKPANLYREFQYRTEQLNSLLVTFPTELREIMMKIRKGKIHIEIEHQGYGYFLKKLDSLTNRISFTLIICSLIVGSSITMLRDFPQEHLSYYGIPKISIIGFALAGILFVFLLYAIIRRRIYK